MDSVLLITLPETNVAPETLGLEDEFPFGPEGLLTGAMLVSGRVDPRTSEQEHSSSLQKCFSSGLLFCSFVRRLLLIEQ